MEPPPNRLGSKEPDGRIDEDDEELGNGATGDGSGDDVKGTLVSETLESDCFLSLSFSDMRLIFDSSSRIRDWSIWVLVLTFASS